MRLRNVTGSVSRIALVGACVVGCFSQAQAQAQDQVPPAGAAPAAAPVQPAPAAQDQQVPPVSPGDDTAPAATQNGDVVVTGSRLPSGFTAPTPVTVESGQQLQARAPTSVGDALAELPAFSGTRPTSSLGAVSASVGAAQALLNLRNLGSNRVLVLVDGQRLPATNVNGSVDTNIIPQVLLSRVEVVTGGASASYGSDAVAGVVNFILDNRFTGFKLDGASGATFRGDSGNRHVSAAVGKAFLDDRLHVVASIDYFTEDGIQYGPTGRKWFDDGAGFVTLPAGSPTTFGIIPDARFSTMAFGGLVTKVTSTAGKTVTVPGLSNMQFGANGALMPFDFGTNTGASFQSGGSGPKAYNGLSPDQSRVNAYGHAEYDLADGLTAFVGATYSRSRTYAISAYPFELGSKGFTIYADNAYLPASVAATMRANNVASLVIGRYSVDLPPIQNYNVSTLERFEGGLRGKIAGSWSFDASFAHALARQDFEQYDPINRNLYAAADAVVSPTSGQIVCRSTLSGYDPGCVPLDVIGTNAASAAAANYVAGWNTGITTDRQDAVSLNARGDLGDRFSLGAGPISIATGFDWRRDTVIRVVDPLSATYTSCAGLRLTGCTAYNGVYGGYLSYNPGPLNGVIDVYEFYGELGLPLLRDKPFFKDLSLNLAGRATHYNTSGQTYTWKIGGTWDIDGDVRIRATRSQDIRAPDANELFSTVSSSSTQTSNLFPSSTAPGPLATTTTTLAVGNRNLKAEVAQTWTTGIVYHPHWFPGFQVSFDYYDINIRDAIGTLGAQSIIDGCAGGNQSYCSLISVGGAAVTSTAGLNGATGISIANVPLNIANVATSGFDLEAAYRAPLAGGTLNTRIIGNLVRDYTNSGATYPNGPELVGAYGITTISQPRWTLDVNATYEHPLANGTAVMANIDERIIAPGQYNPNYTAAQFPDAQQHIPAIAYTDLSIGYRFHSLGGEQQLTFQVQNLFDTDPPVVPGASTFQAPTNFNLYDVLGRRFTVSIKMKW